MEILAEYMSTLIEKFYMGDVYSIFTFAEKLKSEILSTHTLLKHSKGIKQINL